MRVPVTQDEIVAQARTWIGTRWRHAAALRGIGCDCIGLIGGVAAELGISDAWIGDAANEFKGYGRSPKPDMLLKACERFLDHATRPRRRGDILLIAFVNRIPQHFAIVSELDPPYMIHAYAQARKVAENRIDDNWKRRIISEWRFRGVN